jgi:excisionase family DNA binding protein
MTTAERVYQEILEMLVPERERLFCLIARQGFEKDFYSFDEVFEDLQELRFTVKEVAQYLEVSEITVRRLVKRGVLKAAHKLGRNLILDTEDIRAYKRKLRGQTTAVPNRQTIPA